MLTWIETVSVTVGFFDCRHWDGGQGLRCVLGIKPCERKHAGRLGLRENSNWCSRRKVLASPAGSSGVSIFCPGVLLRAEWVALDVSPPHPPLLSHLCRLLLRRSGCVQGGRPCGRGQHLSLVLPMPQTWQQAVAGRRFWAAHLSLTLLSCNFPHIWIECFVYTYIGLNSLL